MRFLRLHRPPTNDTPPERSESMTRQTLGGLVWLSSHNAAQTIVRLLVTGIMARLLAPSDFGLFAAAMVVIGLAEVFSMVGVGPAIVQLREVREAHVHTGLTVSLALGFAAGGLVVLVAQPIAGFYGMSHLAPVIRILAISFPIRGAAVVAESLLRRELEFRAFAKAALIAYLVGHAAVGVVMAFMGFGVWALVGATLAQSLTLAILTATLLPHSWRLTVDRQAARDLYHVGSGFTVARIFNYLATKGDKLVLGRWSGAEALGLYTRAFSLMNSSMRFSGNVVNKVLVVTMARVQSEPERLRRAYRRSLSVVALYAMPLSAILFVLAPEVILVVLGERWMQAMPAFRVLICGLLFRAGYRVSGAVTHATGAAFGNARRQIVYATLVLGGSWLAQRWGIAAVAGAVLLALAVHFLLLAQLAVRITGLPWPAFAGAHLPALRLAAIVGGASWVTATALRCANPQPIVTLAVTGLVASTAMLSVVRLAPTFALGLDGVWVLRAGVGFFEQTTPAVASLMTFTLGHQATRTGETKQ